MSDVDIDEAVKRRRLAEAAAWRVHLTETDAPSTPDFEAWLSKPGNAASWEQVLGPWDYIDEHANEPALVAARQAALGHARRAHAQRRRSRDWRSLAAAIAAVVAIGGIGWGGVNWLNSPSDYETAFGERRVITLEDGSRISLDSASDVTVRYSRTARELQLVRGQARFDVAHDVERPFSVLAGNQKVIATGTAFNIDVTGPKVVVTLIQGHVVVLNEDKPNRAPVDMRAPASPHHTIELQAGQQLVALPEKPPALAPANIQRVTAWTSGQLMFDNETLADVAARINRYTTNPIIIDDPKVASMRISGVFNTGDVAGFVDIVTHYLPVQAVTGETGAIALKKKD
ncbi:MAG TPA: FecR domain-containing protein [Rhizomicrobium sp.]|jgi:transmembrane sensor